MDGQEYLWEKKNAKQNKIKTEKPTTKVIRSMLIFKMQLIPVQ